MGWTRRRKLVVASATGLAAAVVIAILVLLWVPISEEPTGYTMIGLRLYTYEAADSGGFSAASYTYRGVVFDFGSWRCLQNPGGGNVCGTAGPVGGPVYPFDLALPPPCWSWGGWLTWQSPDQHEAIEVQVCASPGAIHLLVAA